jgi:acyl carrier protein
MTAADVDGWDSLSHIDLIVAVEKRFRIRLTTGEVRGLNNVGDFIALISRKAA